MDCFGTFVPRNDGIKGFKIPPLSKEQLCSVSSSLDKIFFPGHLMFQHCIENCKEFSHTGYKGDLAWFACHPEAFVEVSYDRVMTRGGEGAHVQRLPYVGTSAPDSAFTAQSPAVPVERCHTNQGGNLFARQASKLRQVGQQGDCEHWSYARSAFKKVVLFAPEGAFTDSIGEVSIDLGQLFFKPVDISFDGFADAAMRRTEAVLFGDEHLDDLSPSLEQGSQFLCISVRQRSNIGTHGFCESCEDDGIQGVRFCKPPCGFGEVPDLARIDNCQRQASSCHCAGNRCFEPARSFEHYKSGLESQQPIYERCYSGFVVWASPALSGGQHSHIQIRLGDVYTDKTFTLHHSSSFSVPALLMRALSPDNCSGSLRNGCDATRSLTASCDQGEDGLSHPVAYGYQYLLT